MRLLVGLTILQCAAIAAGRLGDLLPYITPANKIYLYINTAATRDNSRPIEASLFETDNSLSDWTHIHIDLNETTEENQNICEAVNAQKSVPHDVDFVALIGSHTSFNDFSDILSCSSPQLISVKFNPYFDPSGLVTSLPACQRHGEDLNGAAFAAFELAAHHRNYELIGLERCGAAVFRRVPAVATPFQSRYPTAAGPNCPQYSFFPRRTLQRCVVSLEETLLLPPSAYEMLETISLNIDIPAPQGANGTAPSPQLFTWSHSVFRLDSSGEEVFDFIGVAHSLAASLRDFVQSDANPQLLDKLLVYRRVIDYAQWKYPRLFASMTDLVGDMASSFAQSCLASGTDKFDPHGYYRFYSRYIQQYLPIVNEKDTFSLLEIGIQGGHSINMWVDFFPKNVFIYGIDIQNGFVGENYLVFKADQSSAENMTHIQEHILKSSHNDVFLIIDDGSHVPEHQIRSFDFFFSELLLLGGTYIIEDVETSYWRTNRSTIGAFQYGYQHPKSAIEAFKHLADDVNFEFLPEDARRKQDAVLQGRFSEKTRRLVSSITFGQNCIIIAKKSPEEILMYNDRPYRFRKWIEVEALVDIE